MVDDYPVIETPEDSAVSEVFWRDFDRQWAHLLTIVPDVGGDEYARMAAEHMACFFLPYGSVVVDRARIIEAKALILAGDPISLDKATLILDQLV